MIQSQNLQKKQVGQIILGSGSAIRQKILRNAGIDFEVRRPKVDEEALKASFDAKTPAQMSAFLARKKALSVSGKTYDLIIGSDQVLEFEGEQYDKVGSIEAAKQRLKTLSGKTHFLVGTTVLAQNGAIVWEHQSRARMQVRLLSSDFIDQYFDKVGAAVLASVGCYEVEGMGITLFDSIEGDFFSILGLPLLPLLQKLRELKAIN